ncbi:pentapeptide repeat-containing protein [Nocardioides daphniae]|uniref:Pentapeptide repeat-containing protein n=1 Tax=Nocardioides daphniae TaxID=402297 RepID=A0A4P7U7Y4_9ACTN|nr:pentapeptide repeat-containing protein [Nocardioides daphniae]QCC76293.1 pentapeptide repeat-containing protein [Nocardioides daphniae]GGD08228.1 hypothetical protein GCM10007231_03800 [Nocardioides daphniae]
MHLPVLQADCSQCSGLCCVLLPYSRSDGFGADKPGGVPCHHLTDDDRCGIHDQLVPRGWPGCVRFDCFGAGQHVTQVTYGGKGWRNGTNLGEMAAVLSVVKQLHEVVALLDGDRRHWAGHAYAAAIDPLVEEVVALTHLEVDDLLAVDLDELRDRVRPLFDAVCRAAAERWAERDDLARADLAGADLRGRDLRGASLRGALLIGADLREVDLTDADLLGADLRGADGRGALLDGALHLTHVQRGGMRQA